MHSGKIICFVCLKQFYKKLKIPKKTNKFTKNKATFRFIRLSVANKGTDTM